MRASSRGWREVAAALPDHASSASSRDSLHAGTASTTSPATEVRARTTLARMNMPLELGMAMALHAHPPFESAHEWMVMVPENHVYQRYVSDLAGYDPLTHDGTPEQVGVTVLGWLATRAADPLPVRRSRSSRSSRASPKTDRNSTRAGVEPHRGDTSSNLPSGPPAKPECSHSCSGVQLHLTSEPRGRSSRRA